MAMMANCFVPNAAGSLDAVKVLYDPQSTAMAIYRGKQLEHTFSLEKANIDVLQIASAPRYYLITVNGQKVLFQQLEDLVQLIQSLKIKLSVEQFCQVMGYPAPKNAADKYKIDAIPAEVMQKAREKKQQKEAPDMEVVFPDSDDEDSDEEAENLDEEDQKLLAAFLGTRCNGLFIVRNFHIVSVPVADIFCLNLCREYAYIQVITQGEQFEVNVIADPELRANARDALFASVQSMELCKAVASAYKQTSTKRIDIGEFSPVDTEPQVDDSLEIAAIPQALLSQTGVIIRKAGFETKRKHFKANKTLTVGHIKAGKAQRLLVETFAVLPFLDFVNAKQQNSQQKITLEGIYIFNLNNQYAIQYAASRDFAFTTDNFTYEFKKPTIADRGAALYYLQQLKIPERRTAVVDETDLQKIKETCGGMKQKSLNLRGLNLSQQLLVEAVLSCRDSVVKRGLFDMDLQLSSLKKDDLEYFEELFQPIPAPSYICFKNNVPTPQSALNYRDLTESDACFVRAGYTTYNWMGRQITQELRDFCIAYRVKFAAEVMPQGSERGDFRALFADFGDLNAAQIREFKAELNRQVVSSGVPPLTAALDFTSFLSERAEPAYRPAKYSLKYHVVTDQTNVNYDVNGGYNWELKALAKAPEHPEVAEARAVIHLFSSMAHLVTFYCPEIEKPYRVFVWRGQHAQSSQVFCQGSQFWVGEAAQKLFAQKLIKTRTEQQFDESAGFLTMFDVVVYHLGQYKRFEGAERKAWQLGFTYEVNARDRFRLFKAFLHFNDRTKLCFQEQVVFAQYNEIQLDPTNALVAIDYQEQVVYVKFGRKIAPHLQEFVTLRTAEVFALEKFKLVLYDDFKPKLLKFFKVAELPYKQDAPATILEAWRVNVTDRQITLKYQFNFDQINTGGSLYILKHGCLSKNYVVVPKLFKEHEVLTSVQAALKSQQIEFGLLDFRDQRLEMENLLTLSALLPSFVGVRLAYADAFAGHRMGYYYACCLFYWRLQRELVARAFHSGDIDSKSLTGLDQKIAQSFYKSLAEKNIVLDDYLKRFVPELAKQSLSAVQKKVGFGIKKTGISIVIGGQDLDEDAE